MTRYWESPEAATVNKAFMFFLASNILYEHIQIPPLNTYIIKLYGDYPYKTANINTHSVKPATFTELPKVQAKVWPPIWLYFYFGGVLQNTACHFLLLPHPVTLCIQFLPNIGSSERVKIKNSARQQFYSWLHNQNSVAYSAAYMPTRKKTQNQRNRTDRKHKT